MEKQTSNEPSNAERELDLRQSIAKSLFLGNILEENLFPFPGIDPEDLPFIFERMFVASRYQAVRPHGSGLGLTIVSELANGMGGAVVADSVPGRGTRVTVTLPRNGSGWESPVPT